MLDANRQAILGDLPESALVLDVGGGGQPFARADWVIDLMPFGQRGLYGYGERSEDERFSERTWVVRDICDHEPWPFEDQQFDFVVCSHTLEDVRDPVWVCHELIRVARAGYIEVPSRLEEQSHGFQGPWTGWGHHRWLIDIDDGGIEFVFKHHVLHSRRSDHFDVEFHAQLSAEQRVSWLRWEGSFRYRERVLMDAATVDSYLADFVARQRAVQPTSRADAGRAWPRRITRRLGRLRHAIRSH